jgi:hypothetical protein
MFTELGLQEGVERLALQELHDHPGRPHVEDLDDVGMGEPARRFRLVPEALLELLAVAGSELDSRMTLAWAIEARVDHR